MIVKFNNEGLCRCAIRELKCTKNCFIFGKKKK